MAVEVFKWKENTLPRYLFWFHNAKNPLVSMDYKNISALARVNYIHVVDEESFLTIAWLEDPFLLTNHHLGNFLFFSVYKYFRGNLIYTYRLYDNLNYAFTTKS